MENSGSERKPQGRIVLERVRDARPIRSFITKKLASWIKDRGITASENPVYDIALNRQGMGHLFSCRIEVHTKGSHWSGMAEAPDLHQAILSTLNHLVADNCRNWMKERTAYAPLLLVK